MRTDELALDYIDRAELTRAENKIYDIASVQTTLNDCATVNAIAGVLPILLNSRIDVSAPMLTLVSTYLLG